MKKFIYGKRDSCHHDGLASNRRQLASAEYHQKTGKRKPKWWTKFLWFLNDQCLECGGEVVPYSSKKAYCIQCGVIN